MPPPRTFIITHLATERNPSAMEKTKRKTTTSSAVKMRYNAKTYKHYGIDLRYDEDADIIEAVEQLKSDGMSTKQAIAQLIRKSL